MKRTPNNLIVIVLVAILLVLPARIFFEHFSPNSGYLGLIYFGEKFKDSALPEVKAIAPVASSPLGYDGQFYAQLALRPALVDPALARALDNPVYRARRIGLPFLAFCLGLGNPAWILHIYALLNFCFWLTLLVALLRFVGCQRYRDLLLAFSLLWSTGTLTSVARALTDFPATVLGVLAVLTNSHWIMAAMLLGATGLIKETSVLSFAAAPWGQRSQGLHFKRLVITTAILLLPIASWVIYVHVRLDSGSVGEENFAFPFFGITHKLYGSLYGLATEGASASLSRQATYLFEVLCPASLVVQAIYLTAKPRFGSPAWRFGIGFVMLLALLGEGTWVEQYAYCRILLPLTFSFNLLIHEHESGRRFAAWYLLGNGGMCWLALGGLL